VASRGNNLLTSHGLSADTDATLPVSKACLDLGQIHLAAPDPTPGSAPPSEPAAPPRATQPARRKPRLVANRYRYFKVPGTYDVLILGDDSPLGTVHVV